MKITFCTNYYLKELRTTTTLGKDGMIYRCMLKQNDDKTFYPGCFLNIFISIITYDTCFILLHFEFYYSICYTSALRFVKVFLLNEYLI